MPDIAFLGSDPARANYKLYLQRNLRQAKLLSVANNDAALELMANGKADALAGLTQGLVNMSAKMYLRSVVEDAKASGLIARAVERTGAKGVTVAPPAK